MHTFHPSILRKYDIRGVVGDTLTEADIRAAGQCFAAMAQAEGVKKVAVCRDGRLSSPAFEEALVAGITSMGVDVVRLGLGPTPLLYYAVKSMEGIGGGVMITGSHNDKTYNGLKMMLSSRPIWGEDIQNFPSLIEQISNKEPVDTGTVVDLDLRESYMQRITEDLSMDPNLTVVWDCGNGAAGELIQSLTQDLPGKHILLYADIDGTFPNHHPDPTIEHNMQDLKAAMQEHQADLGIGFDGDGDRIGVLSETGEMIYGDQLMVLYGREVLESNPGAKIIVDVKSSTTLLRDIEKHGGEPLLCPTGHSSIKAMMKETGALLAGELSGHIFFADRYYGYDDALYGAMRLLGIVSQAKKPLSALLSDLPQTYKTPQLRIPCADDKKFQIMEKLKAMVEAETNDTLIDIDGIRVESEAGWWLLRASNTEAALVARAEAYSALALDRLRETLETILKTQGLSIRG